MFCMMFDFRPKGMDTSWVNLENPLYLAAVKFSANMCQIMIQGFYKVWSSFRSGLCLEEGVDMSVIGKFFWMVNIGYFVGGEKKT